MKVHLYAVIHNHPQHETLHLLHWRTTLDLKSDLSYWIAMKKEKAMVLLQQPLAFDIAYLMQQQLNKSSKAFSLTDNKNNRDSAQKIIHTHVVTNLQRAVQSLPKDRGCNIAFSADLLQYFTQRDWIAFMQKQQHSKTPLMPTPSQQEAWKTVWFTQVYTFMTTQNISSQFLTVLAEFMEGRRLLLTELQQYAQQYTEAAQRQLQTHLQWLLLEQKLAWQPAIMRSTKPRALWSPHSWFNKSDVHCLRCGCHAASLQMTPCSACDLVCYYCPNCMTMGKCRTCTPLFTRVTREISNRLTPQVAKNDWDDMTISHANTNPNIHANMTEKIHTISHSNTHANSGANSTEQDQPSLAKWHLSPAQNEAALTGLRFLKQDRSIFHSLPREEDRRCFAIWAVTGAGKTEIIFPLIEHELARHHHVLLTTPRRDVVLELEPRLKKAFPHTPITVLYGGSPDRWEKAPFTIATTHQMLRFANAFDLVIIDEIDAFPFHNNPMLQYAASQVIKEDGRYVFLTATPPVQIQKSIKKKQMDHVKVPVRYHRHPLPVPIMKHVQAIKKWNGLPVLLKKALQSSLERKAQIFIFVPAISYVPLVVKKLSKAFPQTAMAGTSSVDEDRGDKVMQFRQQHIQIIVTTTILERGVTIPNSDVYVIDSDSTMFDAAALVQMAGRAGRSADFPNGKVYFFSKERTKGQVEAMKQIKVMNHTARKKGYLR
ncbi:DEAD/DEAH box helicase [Longirhabdus pacifica]|uniref:DEAD/DEAH box helicase n=1 Tax=Longirhabdus pacifica TaxID=2305227 RepID=UPI0013E8E6EE|nr:DEAD/DEAH box helicase [Longirhabdus pacifica]